MKDLLQKAQPSIDEFAFSLIIMLMVTGLITYSDTIIHDFYVKPQISNCYPANQEKFCMDVRNSMHLPSNAQIGIGNAYWNLLFVQALWVSAIPLAFRLMVEYLANRKVRATAIAVALLWGYTTFALFMFGWSDWGYYTFRGLDVPDKLPWLNDTGFFKVIRMLGTDPINVEKGDLYVMMFLGTMSVIVPWLLVTHHYRKGTFKKLKAI